MKSQKPTVFVVDDDPAMRRSLAWLIESVGLNVETYGSASELMTGLAIESAGCIVLDVRMPGQSGLDLQQALREKGFTQPIIVVTGHADVPMAVRAMKGGAVDFIQKPFNDQILLDRIQEAMDQDAQQRRSQAELASVRACLDALTPRERQVLDLVVAGRSNKQIATDLHLSEKTVEAHRAHVMAKMNAKNAADLVRIVLIAQPAEA